MRKICQKISKKQAYQRRYEQLLAELLLHLEGYGKQVAHEYYNPSWMNGIAGVGSALLASFQGAWILNADKHSPASSARSTKRRVRGDAYVSGS